jgi:hypothetical protein
MVRSSPPEGLSDSLLPPGLTFSPGEDVRSAPEAEPELDDSRLPPGLTFKPSAKPVPGLTMGGPPQLPEGLTLEKPKPPPGPQTEEDKPPPEGWWNVIKSSFGRGAAQEAADLATGTRMLLPSGVGGYTADEQYQKGLANQEHKDYTDTLLGQGIGVGWSNPKWWAAKLANNLGAVTPGLAGAAAASLTPAGPLGGIAAFAGEAAIANLPRAYNAARSRGLDDSSAIKQAIIESGIASAFAGAMGMAGKFNVTKSLSPYVAENIAQVLERSVSEALVQLGVVQPGLMAGQDVAEGLARGESPSMDAIMTDVAVGGLAGAAIHQVFKERSPREATEEPAVGTASEATIERAAQAQRPGLGKLKAGAEPAAPGTIPPNEEPPDDGRYYEKDLVPRTRRDGEAPFQGQEPDYFYSKLSRAIEEMPANMPAQDVYPWLKRKGIKDAELNDTYLPAYLADKSGKVSKEALQAWVDTNRVRVMERIYHEPAEDPMADLNEVYDRYRQQFGTGTRSRWSPRAQRHYDQVERETNIKLEEAAKIDPQYKNQALPGLRANPIEATYRTPTPQYAPEEIEKEAKDLFDRRSWKYTGETTWDRLPDDEKEYYRANARAARDAFNPDIFTGSHHSDPNTFAHTRMYFQRDRDGHLTAILAESQSDAHQRAVKGRVGYRSEKPTSAEIEARAERDWEAATDPRYRAPWKTLDPDLQDEYRARAKEGLMAGKIPDLPFKTNWQELMLKRAIQLAVNRGATRFAWYNGDQVGMRLENAEQLNGARINYDKKIPGIIEKIAKDYGVHGGETNFLDRPADIYSAMRPGPFVDELRAAHQQMGLDMKRVQGPLRYIELSPAMAENIARHGMAMYDRPLAVRRTGGKTLSDYVETNPVPEHLKKPMIKIGQLLNRFAGEFKLTRGIEFVREMDPDAKYRGFMEGSPNPETGNYVIHVNLPRIMTEHDLYASMTHEFGHVFEVDAFRNEPDHVKAPIYAAHDAWYKAQAPDDRLVRDARLERDNAISLMTGARKMHDHYQISDLTPRSQRYFLSFHEWFAEQVAKYLQTDEKPLGIVDKFFKSLANKIRKMVTAFRQKFTGGQENPEAAVADYLSKKWSDKRPWVAPFKEQFDQDTTRAAQAQFDREGAPETRAVPMQGSSAGGRAILAGLPPEAKGRNGDAMPAHADRMNWFYKLFTSLPQVQQINSHIQQLASYTSMHRMANVMKNTIMGDAKRRLDQWSRITDQKQLFALTNFIQEYAHLDLRPDQNAFRDLVQKHKLSDQAVQVFQGIVEDFDGFLAKYKNLLIQDATAIKDMKRRMNNLSAINTKFDELARKPFMPITHFGKYSIQIVSKSGDIHWYEQTNSLRRQKQIAAELEKRKQFPDDQVLMGMVPKDVTPFLGMPPGLIDLIGDKLNLSQTQRGALDQLRFDYAPAQTFKHQFRNLDLVPGYSTDFQRAYAHFFFHGANHLTRITFVDQMRDQIRSLGSQAERLARVGNATGANKLDQIVKYMQTHFDAWVDPKSDWGALRGLMFHFYLGMNPASAAVNLTQTALSTYPWLASKYGDFAVMKALTKASLDRNNFFKEQKLLDAGGGAPSGPEGARARALAEAVRQGTLSESQAHQLAAISEDRNLGRPFGTKGENMWRRFAEVSSWLFDTSEKYNRHVAFNAAWELANRAGMDHKAVKEAIARDPLLWDQLTKSEANGGKGWNPQEAASFMAAKHAVEQTQFEFSPFARPRIMTGKLGGTLFIFKQFTQNMLFNLASNPGMLARWLVIMGALGGVGGIAGYDNVNSVIKTIAARVFGKDFDLDDEVRHFAHDVLNDVIGPDTLLHGNAYRGFGIPHVMHSMGASWFPTVDMSKSVGMGDVIGFDPMKAMQLAPSLHPKEEELRQLGRAGGAAAGPFMSLFDFVSSNENFTDLKKYEPLLPHWAGSLTHAFRWYTQGRETNVAGNTTIRFNPADTEHMAEIFARGLGFQPRRLTEEWERTQALKESSDFWDMRRQILIRQYADAVKNDDDASVDKVADAIGQFNDQLPDEAAGKAITSKGLKASVRQRLGVAEKQEEGIPVQKSNIPLLESMEPYYPRGWSRDQVGARPVE